MSLNKRTIGQILVSEVAKGHVAVMWIAKGEANKVQWDIFLEPKSATLILRHQGKFSAITLNDWINLHREKIGKATRVVPSTIQDLSNFLKTKRNLDS